MQITYVNPRETTLNELIQKLTTLPNPTLKNYADQTTQIKQEAKP